MGAVAKTSPTPESDEVVDQEIAVERADHRHVERAEPNACPRTRGAGEGGLKHEFSLYAQEGEQSQYRVDPQTTRDDVDPSLRTKKHASPLGCSIVRHVQLEVELLECDQWWNVSRQRIPFPQAARHFERRASRVRHAPGLEQR